MVTQNEAGALRRILAVKATEYAQNHGLRYYVSNGPGPVVLFSPTGGTHGNFLRASYARMVANPDWERRLQKRHTQYTTLPLEHQHSAMELDSSTSSDALAMNVFCHPDTPQAPLLARLFGFDSLPSPEFGVKAEVPLLGPRPDRTEVDLQLDHVNVECKLTEADFTQADLAQVRTYKDVDQVFDLAALTGRDGQVHHYQLIRNVMAIYHRSNEEPQWRFVLLVDQRRPDLLAAFAAVQAAVRDQALRDRMNVITWQEVAFCAPVAVRAFLREKYGIEPVAPRGLAVQGGAFNATLANEALRSLYDDHFPDLLETLRSFSQVSNPLLLEAPPEYAAAAIRLMVVGQQTLDYEGTLGTDLGQDPVGHLMEVYRQFRLGEHYRSTPFWDAAHRLHQLLNPEGPGYGFVWSNLNKVSQGGGRPEPEVEVRAHQVFGVLPDEVVVLDPHVVVFVVGGGYLGCLRAVFPGATFHECEGFKVEDLARVEHPWLPTHSYVTHHPHTLRVNGLTTKVLEGITERVRGRV